MKRCLKKSVVVIIIMFLIGIIFNMRVIAGDGYADEMKSLITSSENAFGASESSAGNTVRNVVVTVSGIVKIVAVCIAIVMLLVLAMKYMSAAPGDKAEIKKSAVVYVAGALILFAVTGLLTIIGKFASVIKV